MSHLHVSNGELHDRRVFLEKKLVFLESVDREDQIPRQLHDPVGLLRVLPDLFGGRLAVELLEERIERQLDSISRENSTLFTTLSLLLFRNSGIGGRSSDSIQ